VYALQMEWRSTDKFNFCIMHGTYNIETSPTCFGVIISPSSGSWHQNFFKTYSSEIDNSKCTYVVASVVLNFMGFGYNYMHKYNIMLVKH
jgi:hypothetical protein